MMNKFDYPEKVQLWYNEGSSKFPDTLQELLEKLDELKKKVPEEFIKFIKTDIGTTPDYAGETSTFEVYYYRPPTELEITKRKEEDKQSKLKQLAWAQRVIKDLEKE